MNVVEIKDRWELVEEVTTPDGKVETFSKRFPSMKTIRRTLKGSALPGYLVYKIMKLEPIEANLRGCMRVWRIREIK